MLCVRTAITNTFSKISLGSMERRMPTNKIAEVVEWLETDPVGQHGLIVAYAKEAHRQWVDVINLLNMAYLGLDRCGDYIGDQMQDMTEEELAEEDYLLDVAAYVDEILKPIAKFLDRKFTPILEEDDDDDE